MIHFDKNKFVLIILFFTITPKLNSKIYCHCIPTKWQNNASCKIIQTCQMLENVSVLIQFAKGNK